MTKKGKQVACVVPNLQEVGLGLWFELEGLARPNHSIAARRGTDTIGPK